MRNNCHVPYKFVITVFHCKLQTETDRDRQRQTERDRKRQKETERDRQRQTEKNRLTDRDKQTESAGDLMVTA